MMGFALKRIATNLVVLLLVSILAFYLMALVPGDPAAALAGVGASAAEIEAIRDQLGLDRPLPERITSWLIRLLHDYCSPWRFHAKFLAGILANNDIRRGVIVVSNRRLCNAFRQSLSVVSPFTPAVDCTVFSTNRLVGPHDKRSFAGCAGARLHSYGKGARPYKVANIL